MPAVLIVRKKHAIIDTRFTIIILSHSQRTIKCCSVEVHVKQDDGSEETFDDVTGWQSRKKSTETNN